MPTQQTTNDQEDWLVAVYLASRTQGIESLAIILDQPHDKVRQMVAEGGKIERERLRRKGTKRKS